MIRRPILLGVGAVSLLLPRFVEGRQDVALDTTLARQVEHVVVAAMEATGVPSVSVAVVRNNRVVMLGAWGTARLEPHTAALPGTRYAIGSISKQFTAAALLLLQQEGRLALDDPIARYLPELTGADRITIRQLLSHLSGYTDYGVHVHPPSHIRQATDVRGILDGYARRPLDFPPGTDWQYSNTNYVAAGAIVEQVAGMPLFRFLRERVFEPLGMASVHNIDESPLPASDAGGFTRHALGPLQAAPMEATGWLFAAGDLAMTAADLALWDLALINRSLLTPDAWARMETEARLADGTGTGYGLGVELRDLWPGHRTVWHGGSISGGFTAMNAVFPDDSAAIVVLTNEMPSAAAGTIPGQIARILFTPATGEAVLPRVVPPFTPPFAAGRSGTPHAQRARRLLELLQRGTVDRALLTPNASDYLSDSVLAAYGSSLAPLGEPTYVWPVFEEARAGMTERQYWAMFPTRLLVVWTVETSDDRFEQYVVYPGPPFWR